MAGYSGTPLARKLGIKEGHRVALLGAAAGFEEALDGLPEEVLIQRGPRPPGLLDVIVAFFRAKAELEDRLPALKKRLRPDGGLWIAWPKRASGVATDLTEDVVRTLGLDLGLVDNKVCAIDDTWSGLRLVVRLKDRPPKTSPSPRRDS